MQVAKRMLVKGARQRSQKSGRREAGRNNDPHVATDWTSAKNNREAFKQESCRLDADGGPSSPSTMGLNSLVRNIVNKIENCKWLLSWLLMQ
jgi:hypothetical protein